MIEFNVLSASSIETSSSESDPSSTRVVVGVDARDNVRNSLDGESAWAGDLRNRDSDGVYCERYDFAESN
jgi:hypothetical protein